MRIFYLLLTGYAASHIYIFLCLRRVFGPGRWVWPVGAFLLIMAASWVIRIGRVPVGMLDGFQTVSFTWMGYALLLVLCLIALDVSGLLLRLGAKLLGTDAGLFSSARVLGLAFVLSVPMMCWGLHEARSPRVIRVDLSTSLLPAGSAPLRLVEISDLHVSALIGPRALERMRAAVAAEKPDILVLVGDLVDGSLNGRTEEAAILRAFPANLAKLAVTGNHEAYHGPEDALAFIAEAGFRTLRSESLEVGGITIAGVDDDTFAQAADSDTADAARLLRQTDLSRFTVLLQHKPNPPDVPFDLMLSGHTHGGQIWPGIYMTHKVFGVWQGLTVLPAFADRQRRLIVSNGLGFWGPPVRFLTQPDLVVVTLRPVKS